MAIAYVQSAAVDNVFDSSAVVAFGSNLTAGNLIVIALAVNSASDLITGITDTPLNTFTRIDWSTGSGASLVTYYAKNINGGASTVTAALSGNVSCGMTIAEFSGADTSAPLDVHDKNNSQAGSTSADADKSPAVVTTTDGQLIFSCIYYVSGLGGTWTAGTNYTKRQETTVGLGVKMASEDRIQTSAGSVQGLWTAGSADTYHAAVATFKAAGGAPAGNLFRGHMDLHGLGIGGPFFGNPIG